jgi:nitronate monooxygenase
MTLPSPLDRLRLPVIGAPLFIVSNPALVIAQCKAGIVGSFPALNARPQSLLDEWLHQITEELAAWDRANPDRPSAPFAVNQIVHRSNGRLQEDMATCAKWKVPIVITSLGAIEELNQGVHGWGGITLHDIINDRFARKAVDKGADGLIAVAAGAGGPRRRASPRSPLSRRYAPCSMARGSVRAQSPPAEQGPCGEAMGADGLHRLALHRTGRGQCRARLQARDRRSRSHRNRLSSLFTGVHGNYLRVSSRMRAWTRTNCPRRTSRPMDFGGSAEARPGATSGAPGRASER